MEPEKEGLKDTKAGPLISNESGSSGGVDSESKQSRRQLIKNIGTLVFGLTLVDRTARRVSACPPPCNSPGDNDANCNSPGDHDAGCGNGNTDEGCSSTESDENCHTNGPGGGEGDEDQSCGELGADEGCGDCNDAHDTDDNCGEPLGGGTDPDAMCGHAHFWPKPPDKDNCCQNPGDNDQGCGTHNGPIGNDGNDPDQGCQTDPGPPPIDTDRNCTGEESDEYCNTNGQNTSTPDEHCQQSPSYDEDQECEQWFDEDEACGHSDTDQDQGCGGLDTSSETNQSDADQNCGGTIGGETYDSDDRCGLDGHLGTHQPDQACGNNIPGGGTDPDERCGMSGPWPLPDYGDDAS